MFKSPTPAPDDVRAQAIERLAALVANGIVLGLAAQDAHWNGKGAPFGPLHELFGEVYATAQSLVDRLAERIATLGGAPMGLAVVGSRPALADQAAGMGSPDGIALCGRLLELLTAYVAMVDEAYRAAEGLRLAADANALQDAVETLGKLGWKLAAHTERA